MTDTAASAALPPIKAYVRLGDDENERTISFRIPEDLNPLDLLERGATIDGNQAIITAAWDDEAGFNHVGMYSCPNLNYQGAGVQHFEGKSLTRVLGDCQRGLVAFLKSRGYTVEFA